MLLFTLTALCSAAPFDVGAADPPSHPLELRLVPLPDSPTHEARVFNPTDKPIWLQVTVPEVYAVGAVLEDASGKKIEGTHTWANKGAARVTHRFERIGSGGSVQIGAFTWEEPNGMALAGGWHFDLSARRGEKVRLSFHFEQRCETRTNQRDPHGPPLHAVPHAPGSSAEPPKRVEDVFCGRLEAEPVRIQLPK